MKANPLKNLPLRSCLQCHLRKESKAKKVVLWLLDMQGENPTILLVPQNKAPEYQWQTKIQCQQKMHPHLLEGQFMLGVNQI